MYFSCPLPTERKWRTTIKFKQAVKKYLILPSCGVGYYCYFQRKVLHKQIPRMTTVSTATANINSKTSVGQYQYSALFLVRKEPWSHVKFSFRTKKIKSFIAMKGIQLSSFKDILVINFKMQYNLYVFCILSTIQGFGVQSNNRHQLYPAGVWWFLNSIQMNAYHE